MTKYIFLVAAILLATLGYSQDLKPQDLYKKTLPSVMVLNVKKQDGSALMGSAFLALKDGLAVTAWHVVNGAKFVAAKFSDGEEFEVSGVVDKDERRDIAVVRVKVFGRQLLPLVSSDPEVGSRAYIIGAPMGLEFSVSDGLLSQIRIIEGVKQYQFTCPASPGNSGGPLINSKGEAIGVVSSQFREGQNLNFAVPINYVKGLDFSLPTQPWGQVNPSAVSTFSTTSNDDVDRLLAEALKSMADVTTAEALTERDVVKKKGGFEGGVPSYLYTTQQRLLDISKKLEISTTSDSLRGELLTAIKNDSKYLLESVSLQIDAIQSAGTSRGWNPGAKDKYSRALACNQLANQLTKERIHKLSYSATFFEAFTPDQRDYFGLISDSLDFRLGVGTWINNGLQFLDVSEKGLAYQLGFRNGDIIKLVDGQKPSDLLALKKAIRRFVGKEITIVVYRYSEDYRDWYDEKLEIDVPATLSGQ